MDSPTVLNCLSRFSLAGDFLYLGSLLSLILQLEESTISAPVLHTIIASLSNCLGGNDTLYEEVDFLLFLCHSIFSPLFNGPSTSKNMNLRIVSPYFYKIESESIKSPHSLYH